MSEQEFQIVRAVGFAAALGLAVTAQVLAPHARLRGSVRVNGLFWVLDLVVLGIVCGACGFTVSRWAEVNGLGLLHQAAAGPWVAIPVTILVLDLVSYVWHRANHVLPFLWRFHQVHHSDATFTVSTGLRFHPGELLLSLPLRLAVVLALGAPPIAVIAFEVLFAFANLIEHGDIDVLRPIERLAVWVCITPALHRLHHASDWKRLNTNFGTVFSIWDRLFGTYHRSSSSIRVETGLPGQSAIPSLRDAILMPLGPVTLRKRDR